LILPYLRYASCCCNPPIELVHHLRCRRALMLKPRRPAWMRALDRGSMCQSPCSSYGDGAASQNERRNRGFGQSGRARHLPQRGERLLHASASRCRMTVRNSTGRTATAARSLRRALRNSDPASAVRLPSGRGVAPSSGFLSADFNPRSASSEVFRMARDQRTWPVISRTSCLNVLHGIRLPQGGVCRAPTTCRRSTLPSPSCQPR